MQNLKTNHTALLAKTRKSHPLSKFLRPVLEKRFFAPLVGLQLVATSMVSSVFYPNSVVDTPVQTKPEVVAEIRQMATESTFRFPIEHSLGISQGYRLFHPGVDIRAPLGSPVYPIAKGLVIEVNKLRYGYGTYVLVQHGDRLQSRYAHLDEVGSTIHPGVVVEKDSSLGTIGLTGYTTGPHLHLEVYLDGQRVNPESLY